MKNLVATRNNKTSTSTKSARLYRYNIPFNQPMLFNQEWLTHRQGFIVELTFSDDTKGLGEAAPLKGFSRESLIECEQLLHIALTQLTAGNIVNIAPSAARFAIDCALNYALRDSPYPFQSVDEQSIELLVGESSDILTKYQALHCPEKIKLKVARNTIEHDVNNIQALLAMNNKLMFNLDANRAWSITKALAFAELVPKQNINYIEEPCATLTDSLAFSKKTTIGIGLDESLQDPSFEFKNDDAIKALILKPTIIGSFERCLEFIEHANKNNIACSLSSSYESSFGISQLQQLAKLWTPQQNSGFDTLQPLTLDIINDSGRNVPLLPLKELELVCQY